jgi:hypothetical protein
LLPSDWIGAGGVSAVETRPIHHAFEVNDVSTVFLRVAQPRSASSTLDIQGYKVIDKAEMKMLQDTKHSTKAK